MNNVILTLTFTTWNRFRKAIKLSDMYDCFQVNHGLIALLKTISDPCHDV